MTQFKNMERRTSQRAGAEGTIDSLAGDENFSVNKIILLSVLALRDFINFDKKNFIIDRNN